MTRFEEAWKTYTDETARIEARGLELRAAYVTHESMGDRKIPARVPRGAEGNTVAILNRLDAVTLLVTLRDSGTWFEYRTLPNGNVIFVDHNNGTRGKLFAIDGMTWLDCASLGPYFSL